MAATLPRELQTVCYVVSAVFCGIHTVMRVTVTQAVVSGPHLKVVTSRKRKLFKISPLLRRRQVDYLAL